jgi:hypothetical protein
LRYRVAVYTGDAIIFVNHVKEELQTISSMPESFEKGSALADNLTKTEIFMVLCNNIDLADILSVFPASVPLYL